MFTIRAILHPTDFSERSEHAFHLACALARDHGTRIVGLRVVSPAVVPYEGVVLPPPSEEAAEVANRRLSRTQSAAPGVLVEPRVAEGDPAEMVPRGAEQIHAT
jgi:nucleotide-binding universal stress UspA family protein